MGKKSNSKAAVSPVIDRSSVAAIAGVAKTVDPVLAALFSSSVSTTQKALLLPLIAQAMLIVT